MNLDVQNSWIEEFKKDNGRAPKILHIGNIANNAYQNAKMLNASGCDCDVLSYDYYHTMACPEWDEAEISGDLGNSNFPKWNKVNLHGYRRPRWFVSGPLYMCIRYLLAKNEKKKIRSFLYWKCLTWIRNDISKTEDANLYTLDKLIKRKEKILAFLIEKYYKFIEKSVKMEYRLIRVLAVIYYNLLSVLAVIYHKLLSVLVVIYHNLINGLSMLYRRTKSNFLRKIMQYGYQKAIALMISRRERISRKRQKKWQWKRKIKQKGIENKRRKSAENARENQKVGPSIEDMSVEFRTLFPERECKFGEEVYAYIGTAMLLRPLLLKYDVVVGYATNPIFLYLAGIKNYIAYEHGTIRDLPYEDNIVGRLMLLSYAKAKAIYVTNVDDFFSAEYISHNTHNKIICGLHGLDIHTVVNKLDISLSKNNFDARFGVKEEEVLFFCPSRHDFDISRNEFIKGEDKMIRAAGRLLERQNNFKMVLVEWGNDTEKIKQIIEEQNGLKEHIIWTKPVPKSILYKIYESVEAVIDQFLLKSYGAITFEVLAANHCVLISRDVEEELQKSFFDDILPYFACKDEAEIYDAMLEVATKSERYIKYRNESRKWVCEHHSNERIVEKLCEAFSQC